MEPTIPFYCRTFGGTIVKIYAYEPKQERPLIGAWFAEMGEDSRWQPASWHTDGSWVGDGTTARSIDLDLSTKKEAVSLQEFIGS